jgi:hypothetical protein
MHLHMPSICTPHGAAQRTCHIALQPRDAAAAFAADALLLRLSAPDPERVHISRSLQGLIFWYVSIFQWPNGRARCPKRDAEAVTEEEDSKADTTTI